MKLRAATLAFLLAGLAAVALGACRGSPENDLRVEPSALDFGSVTVLTEARRLVIATNTSAKPMVVSAIQADAPFQALTKPFTLGPGESHEIFVRLLPREAWKGQGKLRLTGEGFGGEAREIALEGEAHAAAAIEVEPRSLVFGAVAVNGVSKGAITIRNTGGEELKVESLASTEPFRFERASTLVPAGGSQTVEVRFAPTSVGQRRSDLTIRSNDPNKSLVSVQLEGTGAAISPTPAIEVSPASLDFGKVPVGGRAKALLSIRNKGSDPLSIANLQLPPPFSMPTRGREIAPGSSLALPVGFSPPKEGVSSAPLLIYSNDPRQGVLTVGLAGEGTLVAGSPENPAGLASSSGATGGGSEVVDGVSIGAPIATSESGGSQGTGGSQGAGGSTTQGAALPVVGASTPPANPSATGAGASAPPPGLLEGSRFYLGTYGGQIPPESVGAVSFDPSTGMLSLSDVQLPRVDAAAGGSFRISPTGGFGQVDASLGEVQLALPVEVVDQMGNKTSVVVQFTTGTSTTTLPGGVDLSVTGTPVSDGVATLVATQVFESGPFQGMPLEAVLKVRVNSN